MDDTDDYPAFLPAPASYHWTPKLQRDFLESLATTGSVKIAAAKVGMSPSAVYQLKHRAAGAAFKLGCAAAVLIARGRLVDELLDRAIWGYDETAELLREEGRSFAKRRRLDSRLGLAMLARLDKMVETRALAGEEMLAQIIAGDWPGFLSLFDVAQAAADGTGAENAPENAAAEGHAAALALWLAGRDNRANPLATLWKDSAFAREVAQFSADSAAAPDPVPDPDAMWVGGPTPEAFAARMSVWTDHETGERRTDFPPPDGFIGIEQGKFGDFNYERTIDAAEAEAFAAVCEADLAPVRRAAEAARRVFFGLPAPANDREDKSAGIKAQQSASG